MEQCQAHSGLVQKIDSVCKQVEKHDERIEELSKSVIENNVVIKDFKDAMIDIKEFISENTKTQIKMQNHLDNLDRSFKSMKDKVGYLSDKIENNEDLHKIDVRPIQKKSFEDILSKFIYPALIGGGLIYYILSQTIK
jgi:chromosome segregation ATPase